MGKFLGNKWTWISCQMFVKLKFVNFTLSLHELYNKSSLSITYLEFIDIFWRNFNEINSNSVFAPTECQVDNKYIKKLFEVNFTFNCNEISINFTITSARILGFRGTQPSLMLSNSYWYNPNIGSTQAEHWKHWANWYLNVSSHWTHHIVYVILLECAYMISIP